MSSQIESHDDVNDGKTPVRTGDADGLPETREHDPFADPGLPAHKPRIQDLDERAAKRSERVVTLLFTVSMLATVGFILSYALIPIDAITYIWPFGNVSPLNFSLGMTLGLALFCIGAGAVHWSRTLMSDEESAQERHPIEATPAVKAAVMEDFRKGTEESGIGFGRRKMIRNSMFGALALVPLSGIVLLRDLGPSPEGGAPLRRTMWEEGTLIINENTGQPLRPEDMVVGSLVQAMPEGLDLHDHHFHEEIAKAAVMLVRLEPEDIKDQQSADWGHEGILCYSKICTHIGCPATLYEQQTHHALCPCHQSTFDLSDGARVLFGPAGHALPQLRITVNEDGYLAAMGDFEEPPGPSFWERG
ncbi:cytochrome bc1 complex Rieske iron-sulfur subunit [Streptomyces calidiresistens]|uniref:Cytochrome bc1 complex Rieske iron-sulfur subunit n=1 Tax=Streptomyces calidiresistens TaxID=1485586 RepID=A0A7W3XV85_9ACTN|nr:Rieske 2Fe-2S domain-containing protein [Streptomyces calidiresistens]MBB0228695.1 Rieske 2Fe-2S domain-containing protein [Streptomyces calidiresistens]